MTTTIIANESEIIRANDVTEAKRKMEQAMPVTLQIRLVRLFFIVVGNLFPKAAAKFAWKVFQTPRYRAKHKRTDEILESADTFSFVHNNHSIKGYSWGEGTQTILLIHGWESRGTALRSFVPYFLAKGYKVATFDGPAHGNSSGKQTNLIDYADIIRHVISELGNVKAVIAHSFGGFSVSYLLSKIYNSIQLDSLVLMGSPTKMENAMNYYSEFLHIPSKVHPYWVKIIRNQTGITPSDVDITKVNKPKNVKQAMLVHDIYDETVSFDNAEILFKKWENTKLIQTEGFGHNKILKDEKVINKVVEFIERTT